MPFELTHRVIGRNWNKRHRVCGLVAAAFGRWTLATDSNGQWPLDSFARFWRHVCVNEASAAITNQEEPPDADRVSWAPFVSPVRNPKMTMWCAKVVDSATSESSPIPGSTAPTAPTAQYCAYMHATVGGMPRTSKLGQVRRVRTSCGSPERKATREQAKRQGNNKSPASKQASKRE